MSEAGSDGESHLKKRLVSCGCAPTGGSSTLRDEGCRTRPTGAGLALGAPAPLAVVPANRDVVLDRLVAPWTTPVGVVDLALTCARHCVLLSLAYTCFTGLHLPLTDSTSYPTPTTLSDSRPPQGSLSAGFSPRDAKGTPERLGRDRLEPRRCQAREPQHQGRVGNRNLATPNLPRGRTGGPGRASPRRARSSHTEPYYGSTQQYPRECRRFHRSRAPGTCTKTACGVM